MFILNPHWARPDFDNRWDTLNPTQPRQELPPSLHTDISWLRRRFRLADSLRQRAVRLQAVGYGAWEIYLNGRLVQHAGIVQANPAQVPDPDPHKLPPVVVPAGGPAQQVAGHVHIRVQDNGTGMSQAVREKILQPFFTTKPPDEGTGLGLSLSYDVIAQGHGGKLAVESQEGHGSEFTVSLPH